ncbi:uncharacterized protein METZ01_LOCUS378161 [marine metagenome]|uniref:Uncharacterized protein n=1 Tax=marine metagenome TaxID=408172 RepID=A0A382TUK7_9ZZZZ
MGRERPTAWLEAACFFVTFTAELYGFLEFFSNEFGYMWR